jgi:hypothetical protein
MNMERAQKIAQLKKLASIKGKATGTYVNKETGLVERLTYGRQGDRVVLLEAITNAEELYPPFKDKSGRRIRY